MSDGATSILPPDKTNNLWISGEPWHVTIYISSIETIVNNLELEISATAGHTKGVKSKNLSNIWSIDIKTAKRTIDLTSQHVKY